MFRSAFYFFVACFSGTALGMGHEVDAIQQKPNVLFIAIDDLNDWVGCLGGHPQAQTPQIDAFAAESALFTRAYCPAPVCGPSRTALMYGIAPHKSGSYGHHAIYSPAKLMEPERLPLNATFQKNGYFTAGCGKIFHYKEKRGWDVYVGNFPGVKPRKMEFPGKASGLGFGIQDTEDDRETSDGKLVDWTIQQLMRKHEKPFFIALGLRKPHLPWVAPKKYFERFPLEKIELPETMAGDLDDLSAAGRDFARWKVGFQSNDDHRAVTSEPDGWRKLVRAYLATCSFVDANVGRVLAALRESPHHQNTIVVLWGDHGWNLGEKEHWRKMALWERSTRTPMIIRLPGAPAMGKRITHPVSLQDIFPTLAGLCDLQVNQKLDGNNLQPLLADSAHVWNRPVVMSHGPGNFALRQGPWRLIRYADGSEELYHLEKDPREFANLAADPTHAATLKSLRQKLPKTWTYLVGPRFEKFPHLIAKPK